MRNRTLAALSILLAASIPAVSAHRPKLVIAIVIDQFRYDYLTRFDSDYKGGIRTLLDNGAVFTNARYDHFPTVTAAGHSVIMTGAEPSVSGIVGNGWYSRDENRLVTSVCDDTVHTIGAEHAEARAERRDCNDTSPASPRRLLVDTVGDELRIVSPESRVIGVSLKPRSAILPAGHMATGAYWFDESGAFVTSSYYCNELPSWVTAFNQAKPADRYAGQDWMGTRFGKGAELYSAIPASPWGNELIEQFAEAAIEGEKLGQRGVTDVLTISFSSNDYVGHRVGPDDPAVKDMAVRTDQLIGRLFKFLDNRKITLNEVAVVLSADHGVAPLPETQADRKMPGTRISAGQITRTVQDALNAKYGEGNWLVEKPVEYVVYFNQQTIRVHNLDPDAVARTAAQALEFSPYISRVYSRTQLESGISSDAIGRAMTNGFFSRRSGDLFILLDPYWMFSMSGTTHGTLFNYDTHVPVIFMGSGFKPGIYHDAIAVTDIAPTLATYLNLEFPVGANGRALSEILHASR